MFKNAALITAILSSVLTLSSCMVAQQQAIQQGKDDPNFPRPASGNVPGLKMAWRYLGDQLLVNILDPQLRTGPGQPEMLGHDAQGTLLTNGEGKVLRWNLSQNSLTVAYKNRGEIPLDVLTSLQHTPGADIDYLIVAKGGKPRNQQPVQNREPTQVELAQRQREQDAPNHQGGGVVRQQDLAEAIANLGNGKPAPSGTIAGSGAAVHGSLLTFIRADTSTASYKVVRPRVLQGAPAAAGDITGTWIATEDSGDGIMFTVAPDKSVSGREIPAQALKMLMQPPQ